ncbi:MAG: DUF1501 domain-containing protein [Planctomycetes bacterium]|nr:DUF1501 domain-containing protein [Planctomycetota bacterium]
MLLLGRQRQRTCQTFDRRAFLQAGASTVLGLSLVDLLGLRAAGKPVNGSARSVLLLWLWGGPAHLDTWDPKPNAPQEFRGPFAPIATRMPGFRICELFPEVARLTDRLAIVRSLHTWSNDHGVAGTIGLTGSQDGALALDGRKGQGSVRPALGSVIARACTTGGMLSRPRLGSVERLETSGPRKHGTRGKSSGLPPFLVIGGKLHQGKKAIAGEGGGALGAHYDPFRLEYDPAHGTRVPALQLPADLTPERLGHRQQLLQAFDGMKRGLARQSLDDYRGQAFALLTSSSACRAFDLGLEPDRVKDRYGRTRFGQSCLLARRLVEQGVPFVQVNWSDHVEAEEDAGDGGWDHHYRNFQIMQDRHAPWLDQALSALLLDLEDRGLLQSTLVLAMGEFGRSPRINDKAGRDHWEHCYSALLAGAGIRGGRIVGESDARGEHPHDRPVTPADIAATVQHAVGITSEQAQTLGLAVQGKAIEELF